MANRRAMIIAERSTDEVAGTIVGLYKIPARLLYQGRPQGPVFWAESDSELVGMAEAYVMEKKSELGISYEEIYRGGTWELRIYNA